MRGPTPVILSDLKNLGASVSSENMIMTAPKLGQELLHNINLVVDLAEVRKFWKKACC